MGILINTIISELFLYSIVLMKFFADKRIPCFSPSNEKKVLFLACADSFFVSFVDLDVKLIVYLE